MDNNRPTANSSIANFVDQYQLVINFPQPSSDTGLFLFHLEKKCVSLEKVMIRDNKVFGTIKVKNIEYQKEVFVRVTYNNWLTFFDENCIYIPNLSSHTNDIDTFEFEFYVPMRLDKDSVIEFAVSFKTNTQQFWDNRNDKNYQIRTSLKQMLKHSHHG